MGCLRRGILADTLGSMLHQLYITSPMGLASGSQTSHTAHLVDKPVPQHRDSAS